MENRNMRDDQAQRSTDEQESQPSIDEDKAHSFPDCPWCGYAPFQPSRYSGWCRLALNSDNPKYMLYNWRTVRKHVEEEHGAEWTLWLLQNGE